MMTMLERAARAAWEENRKLCAHEIFLPPWEEEGDALREDWIAIARAVLMAVRGEVCDSVVIEFIDKVIGERPTEKNY